MASRPSSSASSVNEQAPSTRETSQEPMQPFQRETSPEPMQPFQREGSQAKSVDGTALTETNTIRTASPATSHHSVQSGQQTHETASVHSATDRKSSNASSINATKSNATQSVISNVSANRSVASEVPKQDAQKPLSNVSTPIQTDTTSEQQKDQGRPIQPQVSPYSVSSLSYTDGSLSSAGNTPAHQQQGVYNTATLPNQVNTNLHSGINLQGPQPGYPVNAQTYYQQQGVQFVNQAPPQQQFNQLFGPDDFKDVTLNIDYGAIEAYNVGMQVPIESLGIKMPGSAGPGQPRFDVVKAVFNQVDANHDGAISQQEFQQWIHGGTQQAGRQVYGNYQTQAVNAYSGNNVGQPLVLDSHNPQAANILLQSGLQRFA